MGLEECHSLENAEVIGCEAVAMNRHDPWAHHAVAHVFETQGRLSEGIAWMESLSDIWEIHHSTLYTHNWWHIAFYYLDQEQYGKVLELYDTRIWEHIVEEFVADAIGAISLLIRLELRTVDVGNRWNAVANSVIERYFAFLRFALHLHPSKSWTA